MMREPIDKIGWEALRAWIAQFPTHPLAATVREALNDHIMVYVAKRRIQVGLWYPRNANNCDEVELELVDVRAADSIRVRYDFDRDGWSILQNSFCADGVFESDRDDWQETTFVRAWARQDTPKNMGGSDE